MDFVTDFMVFLFFFFQLKPAGENDFDTKIILISLWSSGVTENENFDVSNFWFPKSSWLFSYKVKMNVFIDWQHCLVLEQK